MSLFDMEKEFENNNKTNKTKEIIMSDAIRITATTVTPLLQIDETGTQRKMYVYEDGQKGQIPFFSANGFKGALRRVAFKAQALEIEKQDKGIHISPEMFYLYSSGAALDKAAVDATITPANEMTIRKNTPILSLFGAGLSNIEGSIAVADLAPSKKSERFVKYEDSEGKERTRSSLIGRNTFFRTDAIKDAGLWRALVDYDDILAWNTEYTKKAAQKVKNDKGKEEQSHIQQPVEVDFIIPGVKLTSSINKKYGFITDGEKKDGLSDLEIGCLVSSLVELSKYQIGSAKRISFGILDWEVEYKGQLLFSTKSNPDYVLEKNTVISDEGAKYILVWNNWLQENATKLNLADIAISA